MKIGKDDSVLTFETPQEFSAWLEKNHKNKTWIWVRMYKNGEKFH